VRRPFRHVSSVRSHLCVVRIFFKIPASWRWHKKYYSFSYLLPFSFSKFVSAFFSILSPCPLNRPSTPLLLLIVDLISDSHNSALGAWEGQHVQYKQDSWFMYNYGDPFTLKNLYIILSNYRDSISEFNFTYVHTLK